MKKYLIAVLCSITLNMPLLVYAEPQSFSIRVKLDELVLSDYFYEDIKQIADEKK